MTRAWKLAGVALLSAGCTTTEIKELWREKAGPQKVSYSGAGVTLGEFGRPGVEPDAFVRRTQELLTAQRRFSAEQYVLRYPDVASEVLRLAPPGSAPEALTFITRATTEIQARNAVENGLKESETLRQAGKGKEAVAAWGKAAIAASELLTSMPGVTDPVLWERLASLRPVEGVWPTAVKSALARAATNLGLPNAENADAECLLWAIAGRWHFERNEAHAAVAAFKRAEVLTSDPMLKDLLRIRQAQALVAIGQESTASSMLVPLTSHDNPVIAGPALATLGAVKLHGGAAQQARPLLEKAMATPDVWSGRAEATADLAITMLILANEPAGVDGLHAAQAAFQSAGDTRGMLRAMHNEAEYWAAKGAEPRAAQVRQQMAMIEAGASATLPTSRTATPTGTTQKPNLFEMPFEFRPRPR